MRMFGNFGRTVRKEEDKVAEQAELRFDVPAAAAAAGQKARSRATGRTEVYAVRVRGTFKGEILRAVAELQLERQKGTATSRKVTEGEVMELMLEAFKTARRNGDIAGHAVPLADDVWRGASEIARRMQITPAEVVERLIVQKIAELGLLARA